LQQKRLNLFPEKFINMFKRLFQIHNLVMVIPILYMLWSIYLNYAFGPGYLSVIDPEYPYLLNGLNCAILEFNRIGHVDHPGTPFQLLTGLFIKLIYWLFGKGPIVEDVISRPDFYLSGASFLLSLLTASVVYWLGRVSLKTNKDIIAALILQAPILVLSEMMGISARYLPDRLLLILVFIFTGICIKFLYRTSYSGAKFVGYSGIIMGMALVTKINFFPILIIPLFLFSNPKELLLYGLFFTLSTMLFILPIYDKLNYFFEFVTNVFLHDGMYGHGANQFVNKSYFLTNLKFIITFNTAFTIILIGMITTLLIIYFKTELRRKFKKENRLLLAILIVSLLGFIMVSKHFKNYYLIPVFSLSGLALYILYELNKVIYPSRIVKTISIFIIPTFFIISFLWFYPQFAIKPQRVENEKKFHELVKQSMGPNDLLIIEPSWKSGPLAEYGLVYGISYVYQRHLFHETFNNVYPNVLTWEGENNPIKHFRMVDANMENILKSKNNIFLLSSPGRNTDKIVNRLNSLADYYNINLSLDTIISPGKNRYFLKLNKIEHHKNI